MSIDGTHCSLSELVTPLRRVTLTLTTLRTGGCLFRFPARNVLHALPARLSAQRLVGVVALSPSDELRQRSAHARPLPGDVRAGRGAAVPRDDRGRGERPHARTTARPHTRTPARPHARTPARPHARTPARPHARTPTRPPARTHARTYARTHARTYARTHVRTHHTHTRFLVTHAHTPACPPCYTGICSQSRQCCYA